MNAKEYLSTHCLGAIDVDSPKPVVIQAKQIITLMGNYHTERSKEEAGERYKKAIKLIPRHLGTLDKREVIEVARIASGKETRDYPIHLEPIEITEEKLRVILEDYTEEDGQLLSYNHEWVAKAILSKLKGDE